MLKIILMILVITCMLSCKSNEGSADNEVKTETKSKTMNVKDNHFGEWEQDEAGTRFREDHELREQLSGYELVKYTCINGGQFGGGSSTTKFTLCSDGSARFYHQSLTTISVDGAGGSDASQDEDEGTWRAIENENGVKIIVFKSTKHNTTGYMEIRLDGSKVHLVWYNEWQEFLKKRIDC